MCILRTRWTLERLANVAQVVASGEDHLGTADDETEGYPKVLRHPPTTPTKFYSVFNKCGVTLHDFIYFGQSWGKIGTKEFSP